MEQEEDIVNKDIYYKKEPDNQFYNYTVHGLNIEGIKRYYTIPVNSKYHHMVRMKKDLERVINDSKSIQKERQKKYDINNRYPDERLYKMYASNKDANKPKNNIVQSQQRFNTLYNVRSTPFNKNSQESTKLFEQIKSSNKPVEIKPDEEFKNKALDTNRNTIEHGSLEEGISARNKTLSNLNNNRKKISLSLNRKKININNPFSLRKFKESNKNSREKFPMIKPRKIIIEYHLINDCGVGKENKNIGHNSYMGGTYNPYNYYSAPKNRRERNIFGALFLH
jgi:hypothetical protein